MLVLLVVAIFLKRSIKYFVEEFDIPWLLAGLIKTLKNKAESITIFKFQTLFLLNF